MNIALAIKKLVILNEERNNHTTSTCPVMTPDMQKRMEYFRKIAKVQKQIDTLICDIRNLTGNNFLDFSDIELSISCYLFAGIWTDEASIRCSSADWGDIVGRNRISELPKLIENLLEEKSPLSKYVNMIWQSGYKKSGFYTFEIIKPKEFIALFFKINKGDSND